MGLLFYIYIYIIQKSEIEANPIQEKKKFRKKLKIKKSTLISRLMSHGVATLSGDGAIHGAPLNPTAKVTRTTPPQLRGHFKQAV